MAYITYMSTAQFARNLARAKSATASGPVFVTDRGQPTYVLLHIDDYHRLTAAQPKARTLLDVMQGLPSTQGVDFESARPKGQVRSPDLD